MIEVPEIDGLTQARRVGEIEDQARSLIAVTLDVPLSEVAVVIRSVLVGDIDALALAREVEQRRASAASAEQQAAAALRDAVSQLVARDAATRDVGELLGISHQRVSQIASR
ncbi:MAG: hypothetical protein V9G04_08790 [Nocardioides sp.]